MNSSYFKGSNKISTLTVQTQPNVPPLNPGMQGPQVSPLAPTTCLVLLLGSESSAILIGLLRMRYLLCVRTEINFILSLGHAKVVH